jgi:hypothetical protein
MTDITFITIVLLGVSLAIAVVIAIFEARLARREQDAKLRWKQRYFDEVNRRPMD